MRTCKLYKDGEEIIVNAGSVREKELRKAGWASNMPAGKTGKPGKPESGKQEPGNQQPSGEEGGTSADS